MEEYFLTEMREHPENTVKYRVRYVGDYQSVSRLCETEKGLLYVHVGTEIIENKRGWTFQSWFWGSGREKVHLSRSKFKKTTE